MPNERGNVLKSEDDDDDDDDDDDEVKYTVEQATKAQNSPFPRRKKTAFGSIRTQCQITISASTWA